MINRALCKKYVKNLKKLIALSITKKKLPRSYKSCLKFPIPNSQQQKVDFCFLKSQCAQDVCPIFILCSLFQNEQEFLDMQYRKNDDIHENS